MDETVPDSGVGEEPYVEALCDDREDVISDGRCHYLNSTPADREDQATGHTEDGRHMWRCSRQSDRQTPYGSVTVTATCTSR
ncbi:hypothetical protein AKJ09_08979 [Labilithrix luteola]|uniref:Uncharacterized protein n=1 Tax=Labilithrix luteola TaxID=1391654 RepID=A0A0K1Q952_9BACT|nr:hypothetical protein [Labilithrix luteola]AKV02316.1 hypothetical protein AKJ09_08979 [Labilithrix luteola]